VTAPVVAARPQTRIRRSSYTVTLLVGWLLAVACGGQAPPTALDREQFVETYVELRLAALKSPDRRITPEQRQQILSSRGITEDDLLAFAEAYGRDVDAMVAVWAEVEQRIAQRGATADSVP
jgi:hypothetical protein